jgi:predicted O-methyltransferase YrrM
VSSERWTQVDQYLSDTFGLSDPALERALASSQAAGLPPIAVSAPQGKFLHLLARMVNARRILEIGTLGGYSAIWLARALPVDGRLISLEIEPRNARVASENIERAGLNEKVEIRVGRALDLLPKIESEGLGPFDFFFIDADKPSNPDYFRWALKLARPGSVIVVDNVIRDGAVADAASRDASVIGVRKLNEAIAQEPRVSATAIQTVGNKGYDGFALLLVA